ncbi:MAG: hypothetical protein H8D74_00580, partial [Chloroflexi bacterium]|nr:hypothetical protein [Chloroflexota bacterium]
MPKTDLNDLEVTRAHLALNDSIEGAPMKRHSPNIRTAASTLHKFEREILVTLIDGGLPSKAIASLLKSVNLNGRQVGNRMHSLALRRFVTRVTGPSPNPYWCLTSEGKKIAQYLSEVRE